jgi:hypothetical protein
MHLQDLLASLDIRQTHIDLTVKTAGTQQRLIQNVGTVGGRHDDDAVVGLKAIHLHQQLVQSLLALIVTAAQTCAALTTHSIDLVDKDDAGHGLFGLIEQVTHAGCAHADIHLHKVRAGDGVEGHPCLACTGAGQQGLTGTRRAHQQHTVGDAGTQRIELIGALEELHNFLELLFFLVLTGHIGKGGSLFVLVLVLYLGLAHVHDAAATGAAAHHGEQQKAGAAQHSQIEQDLHPRDGLLGGHIVVHHGRIGVGCIVLGDVVRHMVHEHPGVGQLIADRLGAVLVLLHPGGGSGRGGQQAGKQPARGLGGALLGSVGQLLCALLQGHGDHAGIQIQREFGDLIALKIVYHRGISHGGAVSVAAGAAQHRPHHQHGCQHNGDHQRIETGFLRLQKNQLQFWIFIMDTLLRVDLGLQHTDIGQVAVFFIVVQTIAHHELVRHLKALVIRLDVGLAAAGLIKDGADLNGVRVAHLEHGHKVGQGDSGVQNVLHDQHILAGQITVQILDDLDQTAGGGVAAAVAGDHHKVDIAGDAHSPHQIGHKDHRALEDGHQHQIFTGIIPADLSAQLCHFGLQLLFADQNGLDIIVHTHLFFPPVFRSLHPSAGSICFPCPVQGHRQSLLHTPIKFRFRWQAAAAYPAVRSGRRPRSSTFAAVCSSPAPQAGSGLPAVGHAAQGQCTT